MIVVIWYKSTKMKVTMRHNHWGMLQSNITLEEHHIVTCYTSYCMTFHFVIFITLMEICYWFLGGLWLQRVSLLLGWIIVLAAWWPSHTCLPCWSTLGCTYVSLWSILSHYGVVWYICLSWIWMMVQTPRRVRWWC